MFRFSIRDILWLTALTAVVVAWLIDHTKSRIDWQLVKAEQAALRAAQQSLFWARMETELAREQKTSMVKAAARLGITALDIEPETKIARPLEE